MKATHSYDPRYAFVTCAQCGHKIQRIDWGSASHNILCNSAKAKTIEPQPTQSLTPDQWEAWDDAHGIDNAIAKDYLRQ